MQQERGPIAFSIDEQSLRDWVKLIRKLRWIGMTDEAHRLEMAVSTLALEETQRAAADSFRPH